MIAFAKMLALCATLFRASMAFWHSASVREGRERKRERERRRADLDVLEDGHVGAVVAREEVEVMQDRHLPVEDRPQLREALLLLGLLRVSAYLHNIAEEKGMAEQKLIKEEREIKYV
jgi:hypothetical protein